MLELPVEEFTQLVSLTPGRESFDIIVVISWISIHESYWRRNGDVNNFSLSIYCYLAMKGEKFDLSLLLHLQHLFWSFVSWIEMLFSSKRNLRLILLLRSPQEPASICNKLCNIFCRKWTRRLVSKVWICRRSLASKNCWTRSWMRPLQPGMLQFIPRRSSYGHQCRQYVHHSSFWSETLYSVGSRYRYSYIFITIFALTGFK